MIKSIQQFQTEGVKNLEKVFVDYSSDMTKIAEELEMYDEYLRKHKRARSEWYIERRDEITLLNSLGSVIYRPRCILPISFQQ